MKERKKRRKNRKNKRTVPRKEKKRRNKASFSLFLYSGAVKELSIEQGIQTIADTWKNLRFEVVKYLKGTEDRGCILLSRPSSFLFPPPLFLLTTSHFLTYFPNYKGKRAITNYECERRGVRGINFSLRT
jgi:hypothetical protein